MKFDQIIIIGDSTVLPRSTPEKLTLRETFYGLLSEKLEMPVTLSGFGGATSNEILRMLHYFKSDWRNSLFVFSFGIVDCAPRPFTNFEAKLIKALGIKINKNTFEFLRKRRNRKKVEIGNFNKNCMELFNLLPRNYLVLPIIPAASGYEAQVPLITQSIQNYNEILENVFGNSLLSVNIDADDDVMEDYHHYNASGHQRIADSIIARIRQMS